MRIFTPTTLACWGGTGLLWLILAADWATVSAAEPASAVVQHDITYAQADGESLRCDIYQPADDGGDSVPVVLIIHGGAWRAGDKWMSVAYAEDLAKRGIAAVAINYRLAPEHPFPAQVDDVREALIWIAEHARQYGWDRQRIGVFGYSAGAHLACMMGTLADESAATQRAASDWPASDPRWKNIPSIQAVAAGGAPCEFRTLPKHNSALAYFLGGTRAEHPATYHAASPTAHGSAGDVPTLFFHGSGDLIVPLASARSLFEKQCSAGVCSEFLTIDGQGHLMTYIHERSRRAVMGFMEHHLGR
ncbi:alpha/beta hydrolase [Roseimaritima ulvae]|uniref:Carboxylesterase NlhH n=1 Tax=Roseimaritima ulvae TaxID=980254 RepID=A0A5B9QSD6_9BACT|nr:alpha/beta hydrolase [Roseimaritima ulvae]QEG40305.1 Carboxylesterase NlhH [Roseimaritima ulvae]